MTLAVMLDLTHVLDTLILTLPAIIAALYAARIHRAIVTPSGVPIGRQVEGVNHTAIANNQRLVSLNDKLEAHPSSLGNDEEQKVPKLVENGQGNGEGH